MVEKRSAKRKISRTRVKLGIDNCNKTAFTSNLSLTGFFVRSNKVFPEGTILQFEFQLPNGKIFRVRGRVAHAKQVPPQLSRVHRSGIGIELIENCPEYVELLKSLKVPLV